MKIFITLSIVCTIFTVLLVKFVQEYESDAKSSADVLPLLGVVQSRQQA